MTLRTFRQFGQGYGPETATITVTIDGNTVYQGSVFTVDEPVPPFPADPITNVLFSWEQPITQAGTSNVTLTVSNAMVVMGQTQANYANILQITGNVKTSVSSGPDGWLPVGNVQAPPPPPPAAVDPISNVVINGIPQIPSREQGNLYGQWSWELQPNDVMTYTLTYAAGKE